MQLVYLFIVCVMSSSYFTRKLECLCDEASNASRTIDPTDVMVHTAKYLDSDSDLFTEDGHHIFSLSRVIPKEAMQHIFHAAKHGPNKSFLHLIDNASFSPYHYAATYDLDDVFKHVVDCKVGEGKRGLNHSVVKSLCLYPHPETFQSVPSLLIEKDKMSTLATCMNEALGINPLDSQFEDTYLSWLHECMVCDAKSTANYIQRCHRRHMEKALKRSRFAFPIEHMSPLDILLTTNHENKAFYTDMVLSGIDGSFKLISTTPEMLLCGKWIANASTDDRFSFVEKCITDTVLYSL